VHTGIAMLHPLTIHKFALDPIKIKQKKKNGGKEHTGIAMFHPLTIHKFALLNPLRRTRKLHQVPSHLWSEKQLKQFNK
jgi:hypothetical protein